MSTSLLMHFWCPFLHGLPWQPASVSWKQSLSATSARRTPATDPLWGQPCLSSGCDLRQPPAPKALLNKLSEQLSGQTLELSSSHSGNQNSGLFEFLAVQSLPLSIICSSEIENPICLWIGTLKDETLAEWEQGGVEKPPKSWCLSSWSWQVFWEAIEMEPPSHGQYICKAIPCSGWYPVTQDRVCDNLHWSRTTKCLYIEGLWFAQFVEKVSHKTYRTGGRLSWGGSNHGWVAKYYLKNLDSSCSSLKCFWSTKKGKRMNSCYLLHGSQINHCYSWEPSGHVVTWAEQALSLPSHMAVCGWL